MAPEITALRTAALQSGPGTSNAVRAPDDEAVSALLRVEEGSVFVFQNSWEDGFWDFPDCCRVCKQRYNATNIIVTR